MLHGHTLFFHGMSLLMAGGLEPGDLQGAFQPNPFYDSVISCIRCLGVILLREKKKTKPNQNSSKNPVRRFLQALSPGSVPPFIFWMFCADYRTNGFLLAFPWDSSLRDGSMTDIDEFILCLSGKKRVFLQRNNWNTGRSTKGGSFKCLSLTAFPS